ncbi:hypothetical protein [Synechococcus sp. HK01-R]|uniref:hypothetical protein n=1 Tax=Synechococcus sp. HK01-R TaxID=2751171 RepID=UPI001623BA48|nr:hypothetical protein [Synechococcus sp. HK01-R]QNG27346.1 hypothetical protein H0O21_01465 [Synechococcus sp. HK01-R]
MRRGIRIPVLCLLLMEVLGILSKCESLRDPERFARRHHAVLTESLGIELKRSPSDSAFRYLFLQVDAIGQQLHEAPLSTLCQGMEQQGAERQSHAA